MKPSHAALLIAVFILGTNNARADFIDGNQLYQFLKDTSGNTGKSFAIGYITGVADAARYARSQGATKGFCIAIPPNVKASQLADSVSIWLEKNPQMRHYGGPGLVSAALEEFFPCK